MPEAGSVHLSLTPIKQEMEDEHFDDFDVLVGDYEGKPFCGPNSLAFDGDGNLFFTDSGPMGETSLEKPRGSVFCVEVADQLLKPLALEVLLRLIHHPLSIICPPATVAFFLCQI